MVYFTVKEGKACQGSLSSPHIMSTAELSDVRVFLCKENYANLVAKMCLRHGILLYLSGGRTILHGHDVHQQNRHRGWIWQTHLKH